MPRIQPKWNAFKFVPVFIAKWFFEHKINTKRSMNGNGKSTIAKDDRNGLKVLIQNNTQIKWVDIKLEWVPCFASWTSPKGLKDWREWERKRVSEWRKGKTKARKIFNTTNKMKVDVRQHSIKWMENLLLSATVNVTDKCV